MVRIAVAHEAGDDYRVSVEDGGSRTAYVVTVTKADLERYAPGATPERLLEASFEFLLEREPKESILRRFELPVIASYFPEYPQVVRRRV